MTTETASRPQQRHAWVGILLTVLGSLVLVALLVGGVYYGIFSGTTKPFSATAEAESSDTLVVDASFGDITVEFAEGQEQATLQAEGAWPQDGSPVVLRNGSAGELRLEIAGEWPWFVPDVRVNAVLTLPASLEGELDLRAEVGTGELEVQGDLRDVEADVELGRFHHEGRFDSGVFAADVGEIYLDGGGAAADVTTNIGSLHAYGEYGRLDARTDVGDLFVDARVHEHLGVNVSTGAADLTLRESLPADAMLASEIGDIRVAMPDEPLRMDAGERVLAAALDAGYDLSGGEDGPRVTVSLGIGDIEFGAPVG